MPTNLPQSKLIDIYEQLRNATNKGLLLEEFCALFFDSLAGVTVSERRVLDDARSQEIDLVLDNSQKSDGLPNLDQIVFVEAKNWSAPVGSAEIAWFDWKVRLSGYRHGFLVVSNGITGRQDDSSSAWKILYQANLEGRRLIVLSPEEIVGCATSLEFKRLVQEKLRGLAVGRAPL